MKLLHTHTHTHPTYPSRSSMRDDITPAGCRLTNGPPGRHYTHTLYFSVSIPDCLCPLFLGCCTPFLTLHRPERTLTDTHNLCVCCDVRLGLGLVCTLCNVPYVQHASNVMDDDPSFCPSLVRGGVMVEHTWRRFARSSTMTQGVSERRWV